MIIMIGFVFGMCQCIFFICVWVQEYWKVFVYGFVIECFYVWLGSIDYYLVVVVGWMLQQVVVYCVVDKIDFYVGNDVMVFLDVVVVV